MNLRDPFVACGSFFEGNRAAGRMQANVNVVVQAGGDLFIDYGSQNQNGFTNARTTQFKGF